MAQKVLAITSCAVGVAHTYMAAENLEQAAEAMDVEIKVETHGSIGVENPLTDEDIQEAEGLIIAADTEISKERFSNIQIVEVGVQKGIQRPKELIQQILEHQGTTRSTSYESKQTEENKSSRESKNPIYQALMNGVSFMVPFVVTGGLLIAIALTIGGVPTDGGLVIEEGTIWDSINNIGEAAMGFMVPILAAYMAYSIADRPGLVPGMIGGLIASSEDFYAGEGDTGFLGGIIAGLLAGYIALAIKKIPVPKAVQSVMPIIFIPIISTLIVGLIFIYIIGTPVASLFTGLTNWLESLQGTSSIVLAIIVGTMIAVDMGGPFNKVAFLFGVGLIGEGSYGVMGMIAVAVCVPPLALGVAPYIMKNKFQREDVDTAKASIAMGLFGLTEGAIPFAAKDPIRVIPSTIVGSVVGAIVAALSGVGDTVAHGGPIVAVLGAIDGVLMFTVGTILGVLASLLMLRILKKDVNLQETVAVAANNEGSFSSNNEPSTTHDKTETPEEKSISENQKDKSYQLTDLIQPEYIHMNIESSTKEDTIKELINLDAIQPFITDKQQLVNDVLDREKEGTTGMGEGIAIPHGKSDGISVPIVVFGKSDTGIEWNSLDGELVNIVFIILVPAKHKGDTHLKILQLLSRQLMKEEFKNKLLEAESREDVYSILETV
ncbi:fructose-specific PTS transporter subunit EIIC [Tetragenococcus muriaticus]|uniref:PTS system mannose-specific IIBCA component n=4 Tax=Tetragenococcus TaxID=51668 RepID=A0A091CCF4_9ENTE|nr:fructose-specific PTS transporter subunit EIIC [Tetragenococcus muriaticus]KFN90238.1 PTS system mannose-specific IIBCA component [Tetragenococcus muriaticus 3MR10-3]